MTLRRRLNLNLEPAEEGGVLEVILKVVLILFILLNILGHGDIIPITPLEKILGGIIALAGVRVLALPAGILFSGFLEMLHQERNTELNKCPNCGKEIHEP